MNAAAEALDTHVLDPLVWLGAQFTSHFHCVDGPAKAYFEIPLPPEFVARLGGPTQMIVTYQTFRVAMLGDPDDLAARNALVRQSWDTYFQPVVDMLLARYPFYDRANMILFWRRRPHIEPLANGGMALNFRLTLPGITIPGAHHGY